MCFPVFKAQTSSIKFEPANRQDKANAAKPGSRISQSHNSTLRYDSQDTNFGQVLLGLLIVGVVFVCGTGFLFWQS